MEFFSIYLPDEKQADAQDWSRKLLSRAERKLNLPVLEMIWYPDNIGNAVSI
jgi:hypothetical protein